MKYRVSILQPTLLVVLCAVQLHNASGLAEPRFQVSALPLDTYGTYNGNVLSRASMGCIATAMNITYFTSRWFIVNADGEEKMLNVSEDRIMIRNGYVIVFDHIGTNAIISNLSYRDNGTYRCAIQENSADSIPISDWASATVDLILEVRLETMNNGSNVRTFNDSKFVELSCDMSGYIRSDEDLYWIINGVPFNTTSGDGGSKYNVGYRSGKNVAQFGGNSTVPSRVTVLTVFDVALTDSGNYTCAIRDTDLKQDVILEVTPASRPSGYPQGVEVAALSSTIIEVSWREVPESERNGNITYYEIVYTPLSMVQAIEESPTTVTTDGPVLSRLLQGLEEYTMYSVSVRAVSIVGSGPLSPPVIDQTLEDVPSGAPRNLVIVLLDKDTFQVSWDRPKEDEINGVLRLYKLEYCGPIGDSGNDLPNSRSTCNTIEVDGEVNGRLLTDLKESTMYNVSVAAVTIASGPAVWMLATTRTTPQLELRPGGGTSLLVVGVVIGVVVGVAAVVLVASVIIGVILREKLSRRRPHKRIADHEGERQTEDSPSAQESPVPVSANGHTALAKDFADSSSLSVGEELTQPITSFTVTQHSTTALPSTQQEATPDTADSLTHQPKLELSSNLLTEEPPRYTDSTGASSSPVQSRPSEMVAKNSEANGLNFDAAQAQVGMATDADRKEENTVTDSQHAAGGTLLSDVKLDLLDPEFDDD